MSTPSIEIVSAVSESGGMARYGDGRSLWRLPKDVKRFHDITSGASSYSTGEVNSMAIASTTFKAMRLANYPLFDRRFNIVVNDGTSCSVPFDHAKVDDLDMAVELATRRRSPKLFVVGDSEFYAKAFERVDRIHLSVIKGDYDTDERFPGFPELDNFELLNAYGVQENGIDYTFQQYERRVS